MPRGFERIFGQADLVQRLRAVGQLYAGKRAAADHILLIGADGMGKRAIARSFAEEFDLEFQEVAAENITVKGDLTATLTNLKERQVLFVSSVHRLPSSVHPLLLSSLEYGKLEINIGQGSSARIWTLDLPPFTLIGSAPKESDCPSALANLFPLHLTLSRYTGPELLRIAEGRAAASGISVTPEATALVVGACAGTPYDIETLLRRLVRLDMPLVTAENVTDVLSALGRHIASSGSSRTTRDLDALSGTEFEQLITALLQRMGFRAETTKASGDGGIDIVASLDKPIVGGRYLIQCKRFQASSPVGAPIVREFYGAVTADRKAAKGILVTTSTFTDQGREFAETVAIELIDGGELNRLLASHGLTDLK